MLSIDARIPLAWLSVSMGSVQVETGCLSMIRRDPSF